MASPGADHVESTAVFCLTPAIGLGAVVSVYFDVEYIYDFVRFGVCKQSR
jgi:hypothetical protein